MIRSAIVCALALAVASFMPSGSAAIAQTAATATPLRWAPCPDVKDAQCASLRVPVDPSSPNGARLSLRVARLATTDPVHRKGVLLFIPGGPGVAVPATVGSAQQQIAQLRRYYDVVTFDPRGVGLSTPVRCASSALPKPGPPSDTPPTRAQFQAIASRNAAFFRSCFEMSGALMGHLSSLETAADIEQIRRAVTPNASIVAYGGSYGTLYGATYLELYGSHVKVLVLDGVTDHSIDQPTDMARAILAINEAFGRMSAWCSRTTSCALHGRNVGAAYDAAVRKVPVTKLLVPLMFAAGQNPTIGWPAVTKMIAQASRGDMTTLNALTKASSEARGNQPEDPQLVAGQTGLYAGVVCADYGPENDYDKLVAGGQIVGREAPRFAWRYWDSTPLAHMGPGSLDCTGWAHPATNPPHVLRVGWHRNVMVANPAHDTSTTLTNAMSIHKQIPGAVFLIADVDGHQSLVNSQCAFEYMQKFWNDPRSVGAAIVCHN